jgi:hypothetical protein
MAITLTPFTVDPLCSGACWTVADEGILATQIAAVALGQSRHVERVLAGAQVGLAPTQASAKAGAVAILTPVGADPSHRDGWMFQVMSWLAAHRATPGGVIRAPHMILAHKGFDGLQLELGADHAVAAAIIFEDKATTNPRDTIRDDVWPDFENLETGARDNVLAAEVVALLRTVPGVDPDRAIQNVIWNSLRHYRVSITVRDTHADHAGRQRLFRGYDTTCAGPLQRRRAGTFEVADLRVWMAALAQRAIQAIQRTVVPGV